MSDPRVAVRPWLGLLALLSAATIWGSTFVVTRGMLDAIGPLTIAAGRFLLALVVLLPLAWRQGYRPRDSLAPAFLGYGVTGIALFFGLQNLGLVFTTAGSAALLVALVPAVTAALARVVLAEPLPALRSAGIAAAVLGAVLVVAAGADLGGPRAWVGNLLILGAVLSWAAYTVQGRRVLAGRSAVVAATGGIVAGLGVLLPAAAVELALTGPAAPTPGSLGGLVYLGLVASAAALLLWNAGIARVEASAAGATLNVVPVVGLLFAALAGEPLSALQVAGGALVVVGVALANRPPPRGPAGAGAARADAPPSAGGPR
ncbi:MAG: DMT family transporter [Actinomycetota bacterium]